MENQRESKAPKLKSLDGAVSHNVLNLAGGHRYSPMFDPYPSDSSSSPSALVTYLEAADPSSTFETPSVFITPVKVEEDVIVMDGIPVPKSNKGGGEGRMRLATSSNSVIGGLVSGRSHSTSSPSTGGGGRGSGTEQSRYYKNRLCRFWENTGACQFGSGCQFAHGREELRLPRSSGRTKLETFKLNNNLEGSTPSSYGTKYPPISQVKTPPPPLPPAAAEPFSFPSPPTGMDFPTSPSQVKQLSGSTSSSSATANTTPPPPRSDWTPGDDGIDVSLPLGSTEKKNPSKQDVDAHIEKVLYGTKSRKRLPVFVEICPDEFVD
ncbi:mRNA decay activator protein ZFP36-like isoform X2 [Sesamum indicum]|uniref:mRNA decay activator protein ZFP36-like isoform X2 n=1 Tax=Sesamum indicum TaxID=4182 RepID=A0A6I9TP10_SESIN|nr:mRNA decay activator protein ZFP36-like isoform X2 [Sesamum indicum]